MGEIPQVASPIHFSGKKLDYSLAPPPLGFHTDELLLNLADINEKELKSLYDEKIVG